MSHPYRAVVSFSFPLALAVLSCSANDTSGTGPSGVGGVASTPSGGVTGIGGANGSGGVTNNGGGLSNGGAVAKGGTSSGGEIGRGGSSANGGSAAGGAVASGGVSTGGKSTSNTGGKAAGGSSGVGGNASGGTTSASGGAAGACSGVAPIASLTCTTGESNCFSFFVASRARMFALAQAFNGSTKGWGGDLRYGTGDGLKGADKICTEIAERSLPGNCRTWKAFLSTSTVNAISRVGSGPWYDRLNRLIARNVTELVGTRPGGITNSTILNNLPNEDGTPHHNEEAGCTNLNSCADNHDIMTGSDSDGKLCTASTCEGMGGIIGFPGGSSITNYTCKDWTLGTSTSGIVPRVGHTWPTQTRDTDDWISILNEAGCAPGYNLVQDGAAPDTGDGSVGDGGGYGGIYCLASQ